MPITPIVLRNFASHSKPFQISYCTPKNSELFASVMKLRYEAYALDNRLTWQRAWTDMIDEWDHRSVSVVIDTGKKLVGSIRVTINNPTGKLSYPSIVNFSSNQYAESSRLCVSPAFRGHGLWYELAAQMVVIAQRAKRSYVIGSAVDELLPTWSKVGFKRTGHRYFNEDIGGKEHEMMVLDVNKVLQGVCEKKFHKILLETHLQENFDLIDSV